jgi:site-specific recombinase XerD
MYRCGLRVSEALSLRVKDVDLEACTVRILHGKGNKARTVGVDAGAVAMVSEWLNARKKRRLPRRAPLFCTLAGAQVKAEYVRALLRRLADRAGIEKRVHPHALRHTHAAELAEEGVPMPIIQQQLGHSNLATTSRYLAHIRPQQVIDAMRRRGDW